MKKFKILFILMFFASNIFAQLFTDTISFESPDTLLRIDTPLIGNIWEIGSPHKLFFDSAYTTPNAIITDTLNYYPPNNTSSFTLKIYDPGWNLIIPIFSISFQHKYDTDSLQDGGYIEVSYDGGLSWTNIANDPVINYSYPGGANIANGNAAFTGKSYSLDNGWLYDEFIFCPFMPPDSIFLKFVFNSDSIQTNKEGWMIDNITFFVDICEGINEIKNDDLISLYPNPTNEFLNIRRKINKSKSLIQIYNFNGQLIFEDNNFTGDEIDTKQFSKGIYLLKYSDSKNYSLKKFIIE